MPDKPLLIYDGKCGFCRIWIEYWTVLIGDRIAYASSQDVGDQFPQIPPEHFSQSVQLLIPDGEVISGARAVFTTLTFAPGMAWLLWLYNHLPGFAVVTEACYRVIARNRPLFYHLTRFTFGRPIRPLTYGRVEWLFLRILAAIYFVAFGSLTLQITGLIGSRGILPLGRYLRAVSETFGARGYFMMPGVFWFNHTDVFLVAACIAGMAVSVVLLLGFLERASLICLYILYLSMTTAGQEFLSFQWDMLLLEAGFLAIFLGSSKVMVAVFRWLAFRLTFMSGAVKLLSHDPNWRNLSAMDFHYWTQPLPTPVAWYMNQLPQAMQHFSTWMVLFIELAMPFLIFAPRRWRFFGAAWMIGLQVLIFITGNYTFFNLLALALYLFLFDDAALAKLHLRMRSVRVKPAVALAAAAVLGILSAFELWGMFSESLPGFGRELVGFVSPFGIVNTYGLFAVMTTSRPEIIVQGSNDGAAWADYEFPFKAGDLLRAARWVAPYQPRLDWQMWFAALAGRSPPWFGNFLVRLLQGSPEVLRLLAKNPFPGVPPKYVRAVLYEYRFTDFATRRATGAWWERSPRGIYFPPISLQDVQIQR